MSIDPILELIKERNAVEAQLVAMTEDRDEWKEVADQMRADRDAYRKERDALDKRARAAERLLEIATVDSSCVHIADEKEWLRAKYAHLEAARKEDGR